MGTQLNQGEDCTLSPGQWGVDKGSFKWESGLFGTLVEWHHFGFSAINGWRGQDWRQGVQGSGCCGHPGAGRGWPIDWP